MNPPVKANESLAIRPASPGDVTIEYAPRNVRMYFLAENELDALSSPSGTLSWTLFGVTAGAAIAFTVMLATVVLSTSLTAIFGSLDLTTWILTIWFGGVGVRDYRRAKRQVREIKQRYIPPEN